MCVTFLEFQLQNPNIQLQKELEATAKNCRILQFKLRKAERRYEQAETERIASEEKLRQLETSIEIGDTGGHLQEIEEELRMAKEVRERNRVID